MQNISIVSISIIILNILFSYRGLVSNSFFNRFTFRIDKILAGKEYYRLLTSGFLHISWQHLLVNMITLYLFGPLLEVYVGYFDYITIYLAGLAGGALLSLFIHRNHSDYSAVGASGAVCGIIFAYIALFPGASIGLVGLSLGIPGWLYGLLYVLYSIYGIRSKTGNVGHDAHLGGALVGLATALAFRPDAITTNYPTIIVIVLPAVIFIYIIMTRPAALFIDNFYFTQQNIKDIDYRYNMERAGKQKEIDRILEKIHNRGLESLTKGEKEKLDDYSKS